MVQSSSQSFLFMMLYFLPVTVHLSSVFEDTAHSASCPMANFRKMFSLTCRILLRFISELSVVDTVFPTCSSNFTTSLVNNVGHISFILETLRWRHNERDGISNHQPRHCLLNRLFGRRSRKTSKLRVTGLCVGNSPGTGEFPAQMASNVENVSIWWRHHEECSSSWRRLPSKRFALVCLAILVFIAATHKK